MTAKLSADAQTAPPTADQADQHDDQSLRKVKAEQDPLSASPSIDVEHSDVDEKSLLRKIDWRLLPAVGVLYLLSFLDRSNVGNARIEGLTGDLHMTGNQYLTGLTLYFVGYVIFEVSSSI